MKITEAKASCSIDVPPSNADKTFTYMNNKGKLVKAEHIKKTPWESSSFFTVLAGPPGSGKTSTLVSILCSKKKNSKIYHGCFDKIVFCMPESSLRSLAGNPFESISSDNIYEEFNLEFLEKFEEIANHTSENEQDVLLVIDDACSRLRNKKIEDKFQNLIFCRRHLRVSVLLLIQDILMISPPIRNGINSLVLFKQVNNIREELIRTEYLNMSRERYREFVKFAWRQHGDALMIRLKPGNITFYRNYKLLTFDTEEED